MGSRRPRRGTYLEAASDAASAPFGGTSSPSVAQFQAELNKAVQDSAAHSAMTGGEAEGIPEFKSQPELDAYVVKLESDMREAAKRFEFEKAAKLRDTIKELRTKEFLFA